MLFKSLQKLAGDFNLLEAALKVGDHVIPKWEKNLSKHERGVPFEIMSISGNQITVRDDHGNIHKMAASDLILNESDGGTNTNVPMGEDPESLAKGEEDVINKLDRSVKFDEVDTVTFGLETDDGKIVKVYVNAEQAETFEKALAVKLGEVDDIEEVLNELSKEFEIVDVEWPDEEGEEKKPEDEQDDGSSSLDQRVYGPKGEKGQVEDSGDRQFQGSESLNYGEELTLTLMEGSTTIESRFTTAAQLMVYHAIIDLGVPEIALARNPYRAAIIKGIKDAAGHVQQNAAMKIALKTFIRRAVDFEKKAEENEEKVGHEVHGHAAHVKESTISDYDDWKSKIEQKHGVKPLIVDPSTGKAPTGHVHLDPSKDDVLHAIDPTSKKKLGTWTYRHGAGGKGVVEESMTGADMKISINEDKVKWEFSNDKDLLTIASKEIKMTLNSEETEKLIKGLNNHSVTVVRDETEDPAKKFVFSPRGSSVMVKAVGNPDGYLMISGDVEELMAAAVPDRTSKHDLSNDDEVKESAWDQAAGRKRELVAKVADATEIKNSSISALLFGGGPGLSASDNNKLSAMGYDDAATTYEENKAFWNKCGITKVDYNFICKQSL
jgi:hypothetical protein